MTTITAQDLVQREVIHCVSSLISTLASNYGETGQSADMYSLIEQAFELTTPILDYGTAAIEAGWGYCNGLFWFEGRDDLSGCGEQYGQPDWEGLCAKHGIEPYDREVLEHWIVSDWLADKLIEKGEKVDKEFQGMCVWARTTAGQAIYTDVVIQEIAGELNAS